MVDNKAGLLEIVLLTQVLHISYTIKKGMCPDFQLVSAHHAVIFFVHVGLKKKFFFNADNKTKQKLIEEKNASKYRVCGHAYVLERA